MLQECSEAFHFFWKNDGTVNGKVVGFQENVGVGLQIPCVYKVICVEMHLM